MPINFSRRALISSPVFLAVIPLANTVRANTKTPTPNNVPSDVAAREPDFKYEFVQTEAEWKSQLSNSEYGILREGKTELQKSSPLWNENKNGDYRCKGCKLLVYSSDYKVNLNKGWVFFKQSEPDSVLMGIDLVTSYGRSDKANTAIEAHCRRCGSHFGHMLYIKSDILHCINGASLTFTPSV